MAALPNRRTAHRPVLIVGAVAAAYLATRIALLWRFQWFVDETTFASFAKDVHASTAQFFIAESDKKGLLPSWLGALLIGTGIAPVTAMRILAAAGAAIAAACGALIMRRLFGTREALLTLCLTALGPFFLVTASVGGYDPLVAGLVTASVLIALHLAERPRVSTALLLGGTLGAGLLTKPTAWVAVTILPATLVLLDTASPVRRRQLARWAGCIVGALAIGYAVASVARLTPLYDAPIPVRNQRGLGDFIGGFGLSLMLSLVSNLCMTLVALVGYLTVPGVVLACIGGVAAWRRRRDAAVVLGVWVIAVLASVVLLALSANPRYLATAMAPLAGLIAVGACATWDRVVSHWPDRPRFARRCAYAAALITLLPGAIFDAQVLADPAHATYPGFDERQYVTQIGALTPLNAIAEEIRRRGGPYPVIIDTGPYPKRYYTNGPWGLDLRLNGAGVGSNRRFEVFSHGTPAQLAAARYLVSDGEHSDKAPRPGFTLILRIARSDHGAVMRLYERR